MASFDEEGQQFCAAGREAMEVLNVSPAGRQVRIECNQAPWVRYLHDASFTLIPSSGVAAGSVVLFLLEFRASRARRCS